MSYHYTYENNAKDIFRLTMNRIYHQLSGIINIIFTAAMICLLIAKWNAGGVIINVLMILAVMIFPVFHPLLVYGRSARIVEDSAGEIDLTISEEGIHIGAEGKQTTIQWKRVAGLYFGKGMIVIYPDSAHGYVLTDRIVKEDLQPLTDFCKEQFRLSHPGAETAKK